MANNQIEMRKVKKLFKLYTEGINNLFSNAEINEKRLLIGSIFPKNFQFEKNEVRTADINPILLKIASVNKGYKGNKKRDKSQKNDLSRLVPLTIPFSNSFYENLTDIYALKELLYNEGLADYNGLPLIRPNQSNTLLLPNGY